MRSLTIAMVRIVIVFVCSVMAIDSFHILLRVLVLTFVCVPPGLLI